MVAVTVGVVTAVNHVKMVNTGVMIVNRGLRHDVKTLLMMVEEFKNECTRNE